MIIINPDLDKKSIFEEFNETGLVFIKDYLVPEIAESIYQALDKEVDWELLTYDQVGQSAYSSAQLQSLSYEQQQALIPSHMPHYGGQFSYAYKRYIISKAALSGSCPKALADFFINTNNLEYFKFFELGKGLAPANHLDVNASFYDKGNFLSSHNDYDAATKKTAGLAAHVLGLTKGWKKEWGGMLTFCDNWGRIKLQRPPSFNTLALFKIPISHYVSEVSQSAEKPRYSVYGWLKEGEQPIKQNVDVNHSFSFTVG